MGWGVEYTAYLHKIYLNDVESQIKEQEELLQFYKEKLFAFAIMTPMNMLTENGETETWHEYILREFRETWSEMIECAVLLNKLYECRDSETKEEV